MRSDEEIIIDRGRGPEIKGTRITVYTILDYVLEGWHPTTIAAFLRLSSNQVVAATAYIQEHRLEVIREYAKILERCARGNPPELQAKLDASHERFQALMTEIRQLKQDDPEASQETIAELVRAHRESVRQGGCDAGNHDRTMISRGNSPSW